MDKIDNYTIEFEAFEELDRARDQHHQQLLNQAYCLAKSENSLVDGSVCIRTKHAQHVVGQFPQKALLDAFERNDPPPDVMEDYPTWMEAQFRHHQVCNNRELQILMDRNAALDLVKYAREELERSRKACDIFEQNSANATEMWELLRTVRDLVNKLQSCGWNLTKSEVGRKVQNDFLALMERDDARLKAEQERHDARRDS